MNIKTVDLKRKLKTAEIINKNHPYRGGKFWEGKIKWKEIYVGDIQKYCVGKLSISSIDVVDDHDVEYTVNCLIKFLNRDRMKIKRCQMPPNIW